MNIDRSLYEAKDNAAATAEAVRADERALQAADVPAYLLKERISREEFERRFAGLPPEGKCDRCGRQLTESNKDHPSMRGCQMCAEDRSYGPIVRWGDARPMERALNADRQLTGADVPATYIHEMARRLSALDARVSQLEQPPRFLMRDLSEAETKALEEALASQPRGPLIPIPVSIRTPHGDLSYDHDTECVVFNGQRFSSLMLKMITEAGEQERTIAAATGPNGVVRIGLAHGFKPAVVASNLPSVTVFDQGKPVMSAVAPTAQEAHDLTLEMIIKVFPWMLPDGFTLDDR